MLDSLGTRRYQSAVLLGPRLESLLTTEQVGRSKGGVPQFYRPSLRGWRLGKEVPRQRGGTLTPTSLRQTLMQVHGSSQVSPQGALPGISAAVRFAGGASVPSAGVAQLVEHLFCKQVVRGSSPLASSSIVTASALASGEGACGFRVLASLGLRSGARVRKYAALRCSPKPRVSRAEGERANELVRQVSKVSESCPSGQREQAVNLPAYAYAGSNPALSTKAPPSGASVSIFCHGSAAPPRRSEFGGAPPQVFGSQPKNMGRPSVRLGADRDGWCFTCSLRSPVEGTNRGGFGYAGSGFMKRAGFAGVAQLVERQPSKLNVESSSLFSRSGLRALRAQTLATRMTRQSARVASLAPAKIAPRRFSRHNAATAAHLAQLVEHVLGKDEVTSSILVVGSKQQ